MNFDSRFIPFDDATRAELTTSTGRKLQGYAVVFNQWAQIAERGKQFFESFAPVSVDRSLNENIDVRAAVDHNREKIIGRRSAGTMRISKDTVGLTFEIDVPETSVGNDILTSVRRGDYTGMSFSFYDSLYQWSRKDGQPAGTVVDMKIREISPVSFPAYEGTSVFAARSLDQWVKSQQGMTPEDYAVILRQRERELKRRK